MRRPVRGALAVALTLLVAGCGTPAPTPTELRLFVAASLGPALDAAAATYAAENAELTITQSNGSSTALRVQIEQGATADVFLSADTHNPQLLADRGLVVGAPVTFAANSLAIVVPLGNPAGLTGPADLGKAGVRVVAAGDEVPISAYAAQLLANLARQPGYPADLAQPYAANVVSREEDVRAVLVKVELGEADAAIVYATDAGGSDRVTTIVIPDAAQVRVEYSGVVLRAAGDQQVASSFLAWLGGPSGQAVLGRLGFLPP
jgi:molybdate transport system substrate-binding protein